MRTTLAASHVVTVAIVAAIVIVACCAMVVVGLLPDSSQSVALIAASGITALGMQPRPATPTGATGADALPHVHT